MVKVLIEDTLDDITTALLVSFVRPTMESQKVGLQVRWEGRMPIDSPFEIKDDGVTLLCEENVSSGLRLLKARDEGALITCGYHG